MAARPPRSGSGAAPRSIAACTFFGVPTPMVSAMPQWSTPISFISATTCSTSSALTSPSYGQPSATETAARTLMPCGLRGLDDRRKRSTLSAIEQLMLLPAERLARRGEDHDLVGPLFARRRERGVEALHVRHQHRIAHAGLARRSPAITCGVVAHLRHPLRADEAGDLDLLQPGGLQAVHQLDLDRGRATGCFSFCRPSRGPTSTRVTAARQ